MVQLSTLNSPTSSARFDLQVKELSTVLRALLALTFRSKNCQLSTVNSLKLVAVQNSRQMRDFIHMPESIYKGCPQYVPDWQSEIADFFDPKKNPGLEFSDVQAFLVYSAGVPVGRIAGIVNHRANERWHVRNVRFSMIEFIDDLEVARMLIAAVERWGRERGMNRLQGPMGITDFDKEGMLVDDFQLTGSMNTYYNPEYYPHHLEQLGLTKEADWLQLRIEIPQEVPAKYSRVAQYCRQQMGLRVVKATASDIVSGGYGHKIFQLMNEAYKPVFGFSELSAEQIDIFLNKYIRLIDLQLIPIILNEQGEIVGVAITMGSLSAALQKSGGQLWPFGWWHMLKSVKWHTEDHAEMLLIAVRPDYQGYGVNAMFFDHLIPIYNKCGFRWAETGPQLENNVRELTQWKPLHPTFVKRRRCYCKELRIKDKG